MNRKNLTRSTVIALIAAIGLGAGGAAHAWRGEGPGDGGCYAMRDAMRGGNPGAMAQKRLDRLHEQLKLEPAQEAAWQEWSNGQRERMGRHAAQREDMRALRELPAPERMEKMLARMKEHQKDLEGALTSTRAFYGQLTPQQREVFDRNMPPMAPRGRDGRGPGGGGPGAGPGPRN